MISFWPLGVGLSSSTQATSYFWSFHSHKGRGWAKSLYCTQGQVPLLQLQHLLLCEHPWLWLCWGHRDSPHPHTHQSEPGSKSEYQSCSRLCHVHLHL